ncbi:uncharacterized protein I206_107780 [Kwoniella pini CBS 10737]
MSSYTPPLPPVMSRENSSEYAGLAQPSSSHGGSTANPSDVVAQLSKSLEAEAGPSRLSPASALLQAPKTGNRRASKSVSGSRPTLGTPAKRTQSYYTPQVRSTDSLPTPSSIPSSPILGPNVIKRKTSVPTVSRRYNSREDEGVNGMTDSIYLELTGNGGSGNGKGKDRAHAESRARSTSTSIVVPQTQNLTENSTYTFPSASMSVSSLHQVPELSHSSHQGWPGVPLSPPPSDQESTNCPPILPTASSSASTSSSAFIRSAYEVGDSLLSWVKPKKQRRLTTGRRRGSDEDSEKGLIGSDEDVDRGSGQSARPAGKFWGIWDNPNPSSDDGASSSDYFVLPPTPPAEDDEPSQFQAALSQNGYYPATLPTPALSSKSLSRDNSRRNKLKKVFRPRDQDESEGNSRGWLTNILAGYRGGKTTEVLKELGWTVGILVMTFFVTAGLVLWLIKSIPITTLKRVPQSTTDLQLLSAEIRSYMASSDAGWWHTIGVLTFVGCWKHAWSVPGAVILNILVGSLLDPMPALGLLTIITATGSLGAYMLSRPLAPLIAVLFPKPLALVQAALVPDSVPAPATSHPIVGETITPIQASSDPSQPAIGGPTEKSTVWRRLLIMRAMGFVPWSGMNVACGVVGVDWKVFWLTTAAGSASWSYVTASVGHILSRLKIPTDALATTSADGLGGENLTSLLRDPVLISKLVFLSALTLLPVILKRRNNNENSQSDQTQQMNSPISSSSNSTTPRSSYELAERQSRPFVHTQISNIIRLDLDGSANRSLPPMSPLSQSLSHFTPTPRMFDLFSIGRTVIRTGQRGLNGGIRGARRILRGSNGN